jgi:hypothetical protein
VYHCSDIARPAQYRPAFWLWERKGEVPRKIKRKWKNQSQEPEKLKERKNRKKNITNSMEQSHS